MKFKLWPADATTTFEKALYAFFAIGVPVAYLFMLLSAAGIFHNFYQANVKAAGSGWHMIGTILALGEILFAISVVEEKDHIFKSSTGEAIALIALAAISLLSFAGFVFNIG